MTLNIPALKITLMDISERIRRARLDRGMGVRAFGKSIGVTGAAVSQWESGGGITVGNRVLISQALDISIADLMPKPKGAPPSGGLNAQEELLLDSFRTLDPKLREAYLRMIVAQAASEKD